MQKKEYSFELGDKKLTASFSDLALRASGSVIMSCDDTVMLVTATMSKHPREGADFLPLTVDYEEKFYASGQILGNKFVRREGKPSDEAILSGRIVDRTIRPLFAQHIRHEIQIVVTTLSIGRGDADVLAVIGTSLALGVSDIPWDGPVSAARVSVAEQNGSFELIACGKDGALNMIECAGDEASEEAVAKALADASAEIERMQGFQKKVIAELGRPKRSFAAPMVAPAAIAFFESEITPQLETYVFGGISGDEKTVELGERWKLIASERFPDEDHSALYEIYESAVNELIHKEAIDKGRRADGRGLDEIRPLFAQAGDISPVVHGSGVFYRGETHVLSMLTLGGPQDALMKEGADKADAKRFIHHYNFPPFSTGETGRMGGTNRRMIGHGALAEKALVPVIPPKESFPYTIRIVSEALSSNGSTSMGSVCGGTIALMDAGVPIKRPVAGIASGLMMRDAEHYVLLTDIQGPEDHHGDMDFKVAGTRDGITAIQMDIKVQGIPLRILGEALEKAKAARMKILDVIEAAIPAPRKDISPNAPKIVSVKVRVDQIGLVIGPGGKTINGIKDLTGVEGIDVEDDGTVFITGKNGTAEQAADMIFQLTREYKKGDRMTGEVTRVTDFGAFVKIGPNAEGLVRASEIASFRIDRIEKYLKEGDKVPVIVKDIDEKKRINLSIKDADASFIKPHGDEKQGA